MTRSTIGRAWFVLLVSLASCVATETGNPRNNPVVDPSVLSGRSEGIPTPASTTVTIEGAAGAIEPPEGEVLAWGLDDPSEPARAPVAEDGSFRLTVIVGFEPTVRLRARDPRGARSSPVDVRVVEPALELLVPRLTCLRIEPGSSIDVRDRATIVVRNDCDAPVARMRARLREATLGFELLDEGPLALAPGEAATIEIGKASAVEDAEDIVILEVAEPVVERRAVSIVAR